MKKIIIFLLCLITIFSLSGCKGSGEQEKVSVTWEFATYSEISSFYEEFKENNQEKYFICDFPGDYFTESGYTFTASNVPKDKAESKSGNIKFENPKFTFDATHKETLENQKEIVVEGSGEFINISSKVFNPDSKVEIYSQNYASCSALLEGTLICVFDVRTKDYGKKVFSKVIGKQLQKVDGGITDDPLGDMHNHEEILTSRIEFLQIYNGFAEYNVERYIMPDMKKLACLFNKDELYHLSGVDSTLYCAEAGLNYQTDYPFNAYFCIADFRQCYGMMLIKNYYLQGKCIDVSDKEIDIENAEITVEKIGNSEKYGVYADGILISEFEYLKEIDGVSIETVIEEIKSAYENIIIYEDEPII